ncbi:MAG: glycosyltransferase family 39 protein [Anaerolineales bacterium]
MSADQEWARDSDGRLVIPMSTVGRLVGKSALGFAMVTGILALYGLGRMTQATPSGMGLGGDSYSYVTAADNLAAGMGFGRLNGYGELVPITHYPPFYPTAMAGLQILGVDKLASARWVNLVAFTALVFLAGVILRRETGSNYPAFAGGALLATSTVVFDVSVWAMTETLYIALGLAGLLVLSLYLERSNRWLLLLAAGLVGLGFLTRYVGIALVGMAFVALLVQRASWRRRLVDGVLLLAVGVLPVVLWWIRNATLTGNFANRRIIWHPITFDHLRSLVLHFVEWFVPSEFIGGGIYAAVLLLLLGALVGAVLLRMRAAERLSRRFRRDGTPFLLVLYSGLFVVALGASLSLFDPFTPVGNRILSPVFVSVMLLAVFLAWDAWVLQGRLVRAGILAGFLFILAWNGMSQAKRADSYGIYGLGNAAPSISQSQTVAAVRDLPEVPIVSNGISRLYFWADRNSFAIPWLIDLETEQRDPAYEENLGIMRRRLCQERGYLVLFSPESLVPQQAPLADLTEGLTLYGDYPDGEIYFCAQG